MIQAKTLNCALPEVLSDRLTNTTTGADHTHYDRQTSPGFTCTEMAANLGIPETYLQEYGATNIYASGRAVRLPCYDRNGQEIAARILRGMGRACWKKDCSPTLYGLDCLDEAGERGFLLLTRREMDALLLRYHGFPTLALPDDTEWREEWASLLQEVPTLYILLSSGETLETAYSWLKQSSLKDRAVLVALDGPLSPNPTVDAAWIAGQLQRGVSWNQAEAERREAVRQSHFAACSLLAEAPAILDRLESALGPASIPEDIGRQKLLFLVGL